MLQSISIHNFALISQLEIDFFEDFSVITGETGSGKSILLGALLLVLGQRAGSNVLKNKDKKCVVECEFHIRKYGLQGFFEARELDYDDDTLIRREILPSGKTRAFVNDTPVNLRTLKDLALHLIDIHSQNQNLILGSFEYQVEVLDTYAQNKSLLKSYQENYKKYLNLKNELKEKEALLHKAKSDLDYFQFQWQQLKEAKLVKGEQQELENELASLTHAEEIKTALFRSCNVLLEGELSSMIQIKEARDAMLKIQDVFVEATDYYKRLDSVFIELQDLVREMERSNEVVGFDDSRIELLNQRLDAIYSLQQKHQVDSVEELLEIQKNLGLKLQKIELGDEEIELLKQALRKQEQKLRKAADELTNSRKNTIPEIEKKIVSHLVLLGIPNANFTIKMTSGKHFRQLGTDEIDFLFSANKNGHPEKIQQVASGGELSRLMLSIKLLISKSRSLPSVIFDEIDAGVSGEIAHKMGVMMKKMAKSTQVISITHLPQIAGKGMHHYKVYKADDEHETYSNIVLLNQQERLKELAAMLSGTELTKAAIDNAKELLKN